MLSFFKPKPVLEQASIDWLFDSFAWALRNANAEYFFNKSELVLPTNAFFPQRATSPEEMVKSVFEQVLNQTGLKEWPFSLVAPQNYQAPTQVSVALRGPVRSEGSVISDFSIQASRIPMSFRPQQLKQPEGLVADFAQGFSHYMAQNFSELPPGGEEYWPQATELLAVFMGFGVMFANSAYTFRGSCARCYDPSAVRSAAINELEIVYALALFNVLKSVPKKDVLPFLKKHLRSHYKRCIADINTRKEELGRLQSYAH